MVGAAMVGVAVPVGASSRRLNRPRLLRLIGTAAEIHLRLAGGSRRASGGECSGLAVAHGPGVSCVERRRGGQAAAAAARIMGAINGVELY